ncbi:MAG TPA: hypothetical protein VGL97_09520 [Bryobacteraceae bacterium]|jgi:hypothetical protein
MGDISTANNLAATPQDAIRTVAPKNERAATPASAASAVEQAPADDEYQLTRLSSVLNGLRRGATVMRAQFVQAMGAVKAGTYKVDPMQVSRRIVGDSLASWPRG